jgi:hypothetical protein
MSWKIIEEDKERLVEIEALWAEMTAQDVGYAGTLVQCHCCQPITDSKLGSDG